MENQLKDVLYNYVSKLLPTIDHAEIGKIIEELNPRKYKKNTLLVQQDKIAYNCYFVLKGCLRIFHTDNKGNENTSGFAIENESVTILQSYRYHKLSPYSIECIEDSILLEGDLKKEEDMKFRNNALQTIIQRGIEEELSKKQTEQIRFRAMSPEDRYLEFLKSRPGLAARVSQYQLASYLGMKPESLSRIKRRLLNSSGL